MKRLVMIVAAVAATGCSAGSTEPAADAGASQVASVGDTVRLKYGETVSINGTGVRVQFREVVGDSRCPIDALCVWAGDAHVQIAVTSGSATTTYDLHSYEEPKAVQHGAWRLRLIEVGPSRSSTQTVRQEEYYIRLEIAVL